jgi:hypothetical protein
MDALMTVTPLAFLIDVAVRATALLLLAAALALILIRAAAAVRRQLWVGAVLALLLLPALSLALPALRLPVLEPPAGGSPGGAAIATPAEVPLSLPLPTPEPVATPPARPRLPAVLIAVYLAGVGLALVRLGGARRRAGRLLRGARPPGPEWPARPELRETDAVGLPVTVGAWRPVILVPLAGRSWPAQWRQAVVTHEAAHLRGRDPLWQLLGELACALYWFHPLVHLAMRRLRFERELAADDEVLATGMRPSAYAHLLYELACVPEAPAPVGAVVPLLTATGLKARVAAALRASGRRSASTGARLSLAALGALTVVPLATAIPVSRDRALRPGTGLLVGRLVDEATGRPIPGGEVSFRFEESDEPSAVVAADAGGWFRYPADFPAAEGFSVYARQGIRAARRAIANHPFGTPLPTTLELRPAMTLGGTVRTDDRQPVAGATVRIIEDERYSPGPHHRVLARTDGQGRWRIDGMLYGQYRLMVQAPWGVATTASVTLPGAQDRPVDTTVARQWPLTGWVRDEQGVPLSGERVESRTRWTVTTGPDGSYVNNPMGERHIDWDESAADGSFRLLTWDLHLDASGTSPEGTPLFGFLDLHGHGPATVTLRPGAEVGGVVHDQAGRPLPGVAVVAIATRPTMTRRPPFAVTGPRGTFLIRNVPAFDVELLARAPTLPGQARTQLRLHPGESRDQIQLLLTTPP